MPFDQLCPCLSCTQFTTDLYQREMNAIPSFDPVFLAYQAEVDGLNETYDFVGGRHYDFAKPVNSTIELIEQLELDYLTGHAMKYLCRQGRKPGNEATQDIKKAINCLYRRVYGKWLDFPKDKDQT